MATYLLILQCRAAAIVQVGALGRVAVTPGWYLYVGSARRQLAARLARHQRSQKRCHWHIDYLLADDALHLQEIWTATSLAECALAAALLSQPRLVVPYPRLGASDCRCPAHFFRWQGLLPALQHLLATLGLCRYPPP
ncbi:MAG: GIY-YIG nuclease family protein [Desulfobacca sp.]|uniref:GIY-YIG nuclease family protein n=1 Tax=Desulfobacca sp. TaxID=2067990 RepID=UPI004049D9F4